MREIKKILLTARENLKNHHPTYARLAARLQYNIEDHLEECERVILGKARRTPKDVLSAAIRAENITVMAWNTSPHHPFVRGWAMNGRDLPRPETEYPVRYAATAAGADYRIPRSIHPRDYMDPDMWRNANFTGGRSTETPVANATEDGVAVEQLEAAVEPVVQEAMSEVADVVSEMATEPVQDARKATNNIESDEALLRGLAYTGPHVTRPVRSRAPRKRIGPYRPAWDEWRARQN